MGGGDLPHPGQKPIWEALISVHDNVLNRTQWHLILFMTIIHGHEPVNGVLEPEKKQNFIAHDNARWSRTTKFYS